MEKLDSEELIVESNVIAPGPLDPAVASLFLKTRTNRVTEGYDLSLSAFFGSERVRLVGGDFSVDVEIAIDRAQIDLEFVRCLPSLIEPEMGEASDERRIDQQLKATRHQAGRGRFLLQGTLSEHAAANASGELGYDLASSNDSEVYISRIRRNWKRIGTKTVLVGTVVGDLEGMEIDDFEGWRVIPDTTSVSSGVVAILSVREDWINFVKVHSDSFAGRIGQKARELFKSDDKRRQQLFGLLLRHLSAIGLSQSSNPNQAVLAVQPFVVRPNIENATSTNSAPATGSVSLETMQLDQFLASPPGNEVETLISMGIAHQNIREHTDKPKAKRGLFTALSSPLKALEAYQIMCERKSMARSELQELVTKRVATDLRNLGLVRARENMLYLTAGEVKDPEEMLRYAAAKAETVAMTRAVLLEEASASGEQISEMLITKFGKSYSTEGSKIRVGNALKRWARWLEPHLVDPSSAASARLRLSALDKNYAVGRRSMATPQNISKARDALAKGKTDKSVAKLIGVHPMTIKRWRDDGVFD